MQLTTQCSHCPPLHLKQAGEPDDARRAARSPDEELIDGEHGTKLLCSSCRALITHESARTRVNGEHRHVFCNPGGYVYEIGCFASAPGCAGIGLMSTEFTWFQGHGWQVGLCRGCQVQLGWKYVAQSGAVFFGLILDHLVEEDEEKQD